VTNAQRPMLRVSIVRATTHVPWPASGCPRSGLAGGNARRAVESNRWEALVSGPGRFDEPDQGFASELRDMVARLDPVPERVNAQARRASRGHAPAFSELLNLIYDSAVDPDIITLRGGDPLRLVSFSGGGIRLDLRLKPGEAGWQLSGWTTPARPTAMSLRAEGATTSLVIQTDGTFSANGLHSHISVIVEAVLNATLCRFHSSWLRL
jgi:hypothetical protein